MTRDRAFVFQRSVTGIWATSGAVGILLGIALKDVILDVFTGLAMNLDRPFVIGDWVRIHDGPHEGLIGQVLQISWRTTRLRTEENLLIVIPNSRFGSLVVTNFTGPTRPTRFEITIHLEAWVPVERARRVLLADAWHDGHRPRVCRRRSALPIRRDPGHLDRRPMAGLRSGHARLRGDRQAPAPRAVIHICSPVDPITHQNGCSGGVDSQHASAAQSGRQRTDCTAELR